MAIEYKQTSWETGKVLTAAALNNIEQGLGNITAQLNGMDSQVSSNTLNVAGTASIGGDATILGKLILNMLVYEYNFYQYRHNFYWKYRKRTFHYIKSSDSRHPRWYKSRLEFNN